MTGHLTAVPSVPLPAGAVPLPCLEALQWLDQILYALEPTVFDEAPLTVTYSPDERATATEVREWIGALLAEVTP